MVDDGSELLASAFPVKVIRNPKKRFKQGVVKGGRYFP